MKFTAAVLLSTIALGAKAAAVSRRVVDFEIDPRRVNSIENFGLIIETEGSSEKPSMWGKVFARPSNTVPSADVLVPSKQPFYKFSIDSLGVLTFESAATFTARFSSTKKSGEHVEPLTFGNTGFDAARFYVDNKGYLRVEGDRTNEEWAACTSATNPRGNLWIPSREVISHSVNGEDVTLDFMCERVALKVVMDSETTELD